jgi:nitronate monooxygenase
MTLPASLAARLKLPLIVAPMFLVSGPEMVIAACRAGAIGAFPAANARGAARLDAWLTQIRRELDPTDAPFCPNIIMRSPDIAEELARLLRHKTEIVITSVGSPKPIVKPLHDAGCLVLSDVASMHHAERAIEAGVDGLILLTAGAGGQTGWANGFAFTRAVRAIYDGIVVLAGGISDGTALFAAEALGADLGYMGTQFIATPESMADPAYREMLVESSLDDIMLTRAFTGLETNMLRPSLIRAGLDPETLQPIPTEQTASAMFGSEAPEAAPRRWQDIWSAGHSVAGVTAIAPVAEKITKVQADYAAARQRVRQGV